jgi:hypothetical protein
MLTVTTRRSLLERRRLLGLRRAVHFTITTDTKRIAPVCEICDARSCAGCRRAIVADMKAATL